MRKPVWILWVCLATAGVVRAGEQPANKEPEHYSAVIVGTRGEVDALTKTVDMQIKEYTSQAKVKELLGILQKSGHQGLRKSLEKLDVGQVSATGSAGTPISVARSRQTEKGTLISLVTPRNLSFSELRHAVVTKNYEFGIIQIVVDEKGNGEGTVYPAARVKFDNDGFIIIESYGHIDTLKLSNVRRY